MGDSSIDDFSPEIREALFEVAENLLNTEHELIKIHVAAGSKKGIMIPLAVATSYWIIIIIKLTRIH